MSTLLSPLAALDPWGLLDRLEAHSTLLAWAGAFALVLTLASLIAVPLLVALMPADAFAEQDAPGSRFARSHPLVRLALRVLRNLLGGILVLLGLAMLVLPGQGLLTILAGLLLLDYRGKRRLELALVRRPRIFRALNWIRRCLRRPPLLPPPPPRARGSRRSRGGDAIDRRAAAPPGRPGPPGPPPACGG